MVRLGGKGIGHHAAQEYPSILPPPILQQLDNVCVHLQYIYIYIYIYIYYIYIYIYIYGQRSKYPVAKFIQKDLFGCWGLDLYVQQEASRN